jgi:hypothetical protein
MPENTVSVTRPGKWGNKWRIQDGFTIEESLNIYRELAKDNEAAIKKELRGKDLACFCNLNDPCHADILLELANS